MPPTPKPHKPPHVGLCVDRGGGDGAMPEVGLYGAGIVASVGKGVPAGMAEHVRVWADREARTLPTLGKHHIHLPSVERFPSLREEHGRACTSLVALTHLEPGTECLVFVLGDRVRGGSAIFPPSHVHHTCFEVDISELERARLRHPPATAVHPEDQASVTRPVTARESRADE